MSLEQEFLIDCIENICSVVDQDPAEQIRNIFRLIQDYKQNVPQKVIKIKNDYLEDNLQFFDVQKITQNLRYIEPETISNFSPKALFSTDWNLVKDDDFLEESLRKEDYDKARIAYFIHHPDEIREIDFEFNGNDLIVQDGNHRMFAVIYLKLPYVSGRLWGYQEILDEILWKKDD